MKLFVIVFILFTSSIIFIHQKLNIFLYKDYQLENVVFIKHIQVIVFKDKNKQKKNSPVAILIL